MNFGDVDAVPGSLGDRRWGIDVDADGAGIDGAGGRREALDVAVAGVGEEQPVGRPAVPVPLGRLPDDRRGDAVAVQHRGRPLGGQDREPHLGR